MKNLVVIDGQNLTIDQVMEVSRFGYHVELSDLSKERIDRAKKFVDALVDSKIGRAHV